MTYNTPSQMTDPLAAPFETHPCDCRSEHAPPVAWTHAHHIWPLYEGGPDTIENTVYVCPATHDWIHVIWREFRRAEQVTARQRHWPYRAYEIATQGWEMMQNG